MRCPAECRAACGDLLYFSTRFKTPRTVIVHDACLSWISVFLQMLVVLYVVVVQATPLHCSNKTLVTWGEGFTREETIQSSSISVTEDFECVPFDDRQHISVQAGAGTFTAVTWEAVSGQLPNGSSVEQSRFTDHPEAALMNMIHVASASWMDSGLTNVHTRVLREDGSVRAAFPDGAFLSRLTMADWLHLGGVPDLNAKHIMEWFRGGRPSEQPTYRLTGLVLLLRMEYSNYRPWELWPDPRCDVTVRALPGAWGFLGTDQVMDRHLSIPVQRTRTGITLQIIHGGTLGRPRWEHVILRLVEAIVLFGLAHLVTEALARHVLYRSSFAAAVSDEVVLGPGAARGPKRSLRGRQQFRTLPSASASSQPGDAAPELAPVLDDAKNVAAEKEAQEASPAVQVSVATGVPPSTPDTHIPQPSPHPMPKAGEEAGGSVSKPHAVVDGKVHPNTPAQEPS